MKIFGCGDIFVAKRLPAKGYEGLFELSELIKRHDACFGNLETTIHNKDILLNFREAVIITPYI